MGGRRENDPISFWPPRDMRLPQWITALLVPAVLGLFGLLWDSNRELAIDRVKAEQARREIEWLRQAVETADKARREETRGLQAEIRELRDRVTRLESQPGRASSRRR